MKFYFDAVGTSDLVLRPIVPLTLRGLPVPVSALVDSGALGNRFDAKWGRLAGLDLSRGTTGTTLIGGRRLTGHRLDVELAVGGHTWTAPVLFLENWQVSYQVLGLQGFFDHFDVRVHAKSRRLYLFPR